MSVKAWSRHLCVAYTITNGQIIMQRLITLTKVPYRQPHGHTTDTRKNSTILRVIILTFLQGRNGFCLCNEDI